RNPRGDPASVPTTWSTSARDVPRGNSYRPGRETDPVTHERKVPGEVSVPSSRNHAAPRWAIDAAWARVSTLLTNVGRPSIPSSNGRGGFTRGRAGPPLMQR